MSIEIVTAVGTEIEQYIEELARLRIAVFREYPYLYDGSEAYEANYLQTYCQSGRALAVLARDGSKIVGASTGLPMADETVEFKQPFISAGMNPNQLFYCGESVLLPDYRKRGIYKHFFSERERYARSLGGFEYCCFCGVVRDESDSRRPPYYSPLDPVWKHFGYRPKPDLVATFPWREVGHNEEVVHEMMFWLKPMCGD